MIKSLQKIKAAKLALKTVMPRLFSIIWTLSLPGALLLLIPFGRLFFKQMQTVPPVLTQLWSTEPKGEVLWMMPFSTSHCFPEEETPPGDPVSSPKRQSDPDDTGESAPPAKRRRSSIEEDEDPGIVAAVDPEVGLAGKNTPPVTVISTQPGSGSAITSGPAEPEPEPHTPPPPSMFEPRFDSIRLQDREPIPYKEPTAGSLVSPRQTPEASTEPVPAVGPPEGGSPVPAYTIVADEIERIVEEKVKLVANPMGVAVGLVGAAMFGAGVHSVLPAGAVNPRLRAAAGVISAGGAILKDPDTRPLVSKGITKLVNPLFTTLDEGTGRPPSPRENFDGSPSPSSRGGSSFIPDAFEPSNLDYNIFLFYLTVFACFAIILLVILFILGLLKPFRGLVRGNLWIRALKVLLFALVFSVVILLKFGPILPLHTDEVKLSLIERAYRFGRMLGFFVLGEEFCLLLEVFLSKGPARFRNFDLANGVKRFSKTVFESFLGFLMKMTCSIFLGVILGFFIYFVI